jgi:DinB superfamily
MTGRDAIRNSFARSRQLTRLLIEDFSDDELLVRPVPGANHTAWQLGHLVSSTHHMIGRFLDSRALALPEGFVERHNEAASRDPSNRGYLGKTAYLELIDRTILSATDAVAALPEAQLDAPNTGNMAKMAPTVGSLFQLAAEHFLMHLGQFSTVRRALGKPNRF